MAKQGFKENLSRLEEISKLLEAGDCSLEDAMQLYDEGRLLAAQCTKLLDSAKQKIEVVE